ncbi:ArsC family reductase [Thalassotalea euphylliae]|uniref:ArsC family reductase n=1 Tax=Thalassotalea euphylliae TaxID=1655234 RepID=A0A3E0TXR7_9GAMM|nr:ArsC family reductase [Thalassotalea euphylliae]REL29398.1 ArsC family reductase [Thalassotalea euphylliae]
MTTLYGIPNCDTVKKARKWLAEQNIEHDFHDFRKDGLSDELLTSLLEKATWEQLLNKRSTSFRNLADDIKNNLNEATAKAAMLAEPTLIKRPVTLINEQVVVGFKADTFADTFLS